MWNVLCDYRLFLLQDELGPVLQVWPPQCWGEDPSVSGSACRPGHQAFFCKAVPQVWDLAFPPVKCCEFPAGLFLQPAQIPPNGSTAIWCTSCSSWFCVVCRLAANLQRVLSVLSFGLLTEMLSSACAGPDPRGASWSVDFVVGVKIIFPVTFCLKAQVPVSTNWISECHVPCLCCKWHFPLPSFLFHILLRLCIQEACLWTTLMRVQEGAGSPAHTAVGDLYEDILS